MCSINSKKKLERLEIEYFDVVLVTPSMFNYLVSMFSKYAWKRFIYDEPANIRVSGMKNILAGFYWLITATPFAIWQKHHNCSNSFMKNMLGDDYFSFKKDFEDVIVKNDMDVINRSFSMPKTFTYNYKCSQHILNIVKDFVTPSIKRMLEGNDIDGVISFLGCF